MTDRLPPGFPIAPAGRQGWPWTEAVPPPAGNDLADRPWPRISVVIPSYNKAEYLEETLRSVLLQNYPALELIIIDGGSTDGTLEIISRYGPWIASWVSEADRGETHAINKGFARATGELVACLAADDLYSPGALATVARARLQHPEAGLIYGAGAKVDRDGGEVKEIPYRPYDEKLLRTRCYILEPTTFADRRLLLELGMWNESLLYAMDWEFWLRLSRRAPFVSLPQRLAMLRVYPETVTNTGGWARRRELAEIGRRHNGPLDKNWLAFWPLYFCARLDEKLPGPLFDWAGKVLRRLFDLAFGRDTYMVR